MKRSPLKQRSVKQQDVQDKYVLAAVDFCIDRTHCEKCHRFLGEEFIAGTVHHKKGRGIYTADRTTFMRVCIPCHNYIENNKSWARKMGYIQY